DVRRLRLSQDPVKAEPAARTNGGPASNPGDGGAAEIAEATTSDPLLRAGAHGLLTRPFALGGGARPAPGETPSRPTEPIVAGADARTSAANSPSPGVRPSFPAGEEPPHPDPRPDGARGTRGEGRLLRNDADRNAPDSAAGLSSSGLAGPGGD